MDAKTLGQQSVHVIGPEGCFGAGYAGLTKRELFAAMAMQGLASVPVTGGDGPLVIADWDAKRAVAYADALLAELAKDGAP